MSHHECEDGLGGCIYHPRWNVSRDDLDSSLDRDVFGGPWVVYSPGIGGTVEPFDTFPEAITYATAQARAEKLAAIQDGAA